MYLFQVKTPAESEGPWDYYRLIATIPGDEACQPLSASLPSDQVAPEQAATRVDAVKHRHLSTPIRFGGYQ
jgi:hypothetical protein